MISRVNPGGVQTCEKTILKATAQFSVENHIPKALKVGVLAQPKTYQIWMRLSNSASIERRSKFNSDLDPDIRALAINLLQVEGEKVLDDEKETQDFLLINHPVFFMRDAQGFAHLMKASVGQADAEELQSLAPTFEVPINLDLRPSSFV